MTRKVVTKKQLQSENKKLRELSVDPPRAVVVHVHGDDDDALRISTGLVGADVDCADQDDDEDLADLMPYARPLARALIANGTLSIRTIEHWVKTLDEPDLSRLVVDAAYESLPVGPRTALVRLSVLRGPQPLNGVAGPFQLSGSDGALTLPVKDVEELRKAGWLQPAVGKPGFELTNALREFVSPRARAGIDVPAAPRRRCRASERAKLREVRNKMRKALRKASNRVPPSPAPRYDEVYAEGVTWMNSKG